MESNLQELTTIKEAVLKAKGSKVNKALREEAGSYYNGDHQDHQKHCESKENIFTHIMLASINKING